MFLEDKERQRATDYYEEVLDIDPENAQAYLGLLMASLNISREDDLKNATVSLDEQAYFQKAMRFATDEYQVKLKQYLKDNIFGKVQHITKNTRNAKDYRTAIELLKKLPDQKDAMELLSEYSEKEKKLQQQEDMEKANRLMHEATSESLHSAIDLLQKYDSETNSIQIAKCKSMIASIEQEAAEKLKKRKRTFIIICCICLLCLAFVFTLVTINRNKKIAANKIRAEEIYNNFLGCRFSGSDTDYDEEFVAWVMGYGAELNPYKTYWTTKTKCSLYFKKDGTVDCFYSLLSTPAAYPSSWERPDDYSQDSFDTYYDFEVSVDLDGTVYVHIGYFSCVVDVDTNNMPEKIYGFEGVNLEVILRE